MASSSANANVEYPGRFFGSGNVPLQKKSMNHHCRLGNIGMLREVGDDVWSYLENSPVGPLVKLAGREFIWSAKVVHNLLARRLFTEKKHEFWCLVDNQPIRFSLCEVSAMTGMNIEPYEVARGFDGDHSELWSLMNVGLNDGPSLEELRKVLVRCSSWTYERRRMVACLCVIHVGVLGLHPGSRIPLHLAKRVLDVKEFEKFPWGRQTCDALVDGVRLADYSGYSYCVGGFVPLLQIWAYESVLVVGERFGNKLDDIELPLLCWGTSRMRFNFETVIEEDKNAQENKKVCNILVLFRRF